jgi:beta-phosphoglucomutase family hydrolase
MGHPVQALLFDLDGTLIDSMPHHGKAWERWHAEHRLPFDHDRFFIETAGRTNSEVISQILPDASPEDIAALGEEKERFYREAASRSLELIHGFEAFRREARARGLKLAICTAAPPENIAIANARFGLDKLVDTTVSPADGLRGKPHPDIFLEAARRLGIAPEACIVFEDAPLGVEAARRAGMRAVALTTSLQAAEFQSFDNLLAAIPDFTAFDLSTALQS